MRKKPNKPLSLLPEDQEEGLDPMVFYCPPTTRLGVSVNFKVEPSLERVIDKVVESKLLPFETRSDFWRWAGHYGAQTCTDALQDPDLLDTMARRRALIAFALVQEELTAFNRIIEGIDQSVVPLLQAGMQDEAVRFVKRIVGEVDEMQDSSWRARLLAVVQQKYPQIVGEVVNEGEKTRRKK